VCIYYAADYVSDGNPLFLFIVQKKKEEEEEERKKSFS
jgi:hypothetical protein